jgi:hypothetical protein
MLTILLRIYWHAIRYNSGNNKCHCEIIPNIFSLQSTHWVVPDCCLTFSSLEDKSWMLIISGLQFQAVLYEKDRKFFQNISHFFQNAALVNNKDFRPCCCCPHDEVPYLLCSLIIRSTCLNIMFRTMVHKVCIYALPNHDNAKQPSLFGPTHHL